MPTYRYECSSCGAVHRIFHSIAEKPKRNCPACGGRLKRLIGSGGGVLLRGEGFYTTDYRSEAYRQAAKKEREGGSSEAGPAEKPKEKDGGGAGGGGRGSTPPGRSKRARKGD